jgi:hypothetical protein
VRGAVKNETLRHKRWFKLFPLWTFHVYVATFQQHLHMGYISLSWYNIPELVVPIRISQRVTANKEATEQMVPLVLRWSHHFESFTVATMTWLTIIEYMRHKWPRICSTCRQYFPFLSSFMTCHRVCNSINTTGATSEAGTAYLFAEHLSSSPVFSGVRVTRSLVLCACFVDRCLSFCTLSFGHCVVCSSSIYGFWLLLWYLQTLLMKPGDQKTKW